MVKYKVTVSRTSCISCGVAPAVCPEVFELGSDNGKNKVVDKYSVELTDEISVGVIPKELYECAKHGADSCPVSAIVVEKVED
ncbi:MAG: ferredoxin [Sulfolobales archaeon]